MTRRAYAFSDKVCNFRIAEDRPNPTLPLGPAGFPYGQNGNEERIAKLLSEANKAMVANVAAAASKEANLPVTSSAGSPQVRTAKTSITFNPVPTRLLQVIYYYSDILVLLE